MELTLKLTDEQAQIILNALVQQPYLQVVDVVNEIQKQASEQIEAE